MPPSDKGDPQDPKRVPPGVRPQPNNPLHGLTLEMIVTRLVEHYGWRELGELIPINCFRINASIRSSLKYLRLTPRARARVEELYLYTFR